MSFFLAGALLTLGFNLLHTSSMVLAFSGWAHQRRERWMAVPCVHLLAALLVGSQHTEHWLHNCNLKSHCQLRPSLRRSLQVTKKGCPVLAEASAGCMRLSSHSGKMMLTWVSFCALLWVSRGKASADPGKVA